MSNTTEELSLESNHLDSSKSENQNTDAQTSVKRSHTDIMSPKNKKIRSASDFTVTLLSTDNSSCSIENKVNSNQSTGKEIDFSILNMGPNLQNPLSERNIRVDTENNNAQYDVQSPAEKSKSETTYNDSVNTNCVSQLQDNNDTASINVSIARLENTQKEAEQDTLDYVAKLPDHRTHQLEDPGAGLPRTGVTPTHYPCSGDEDDDNYLDSSDEEDCVDYNTVNDDDESCDEGKDRWGSSF